MKSPVYPSNNIKYTAGLKKGQQHQVPVGDWGNVYACVSIT